MKFILPIVASIALSAAFLAEAVTLENDAMRVLFAEARDGFAVTGIVNRLEGETRFVNPVANENSPDFWQVELTSTNAEGKVVHRWVSNRWSAKAKRAEPIKDGVRFVFTGMQIEKGDNGLDVVCEVTLPPKARESLWRIRATCTSPKWGLYYTIYPTLRHVTKNGEGDFYEPTHDMGWLRHRSYDGTGVKAKAGYSSSFHPKVAAFAIGDAGLLFALHNARGETTKIFWEGTQNVTCFTPPPGGGRGCRVADPGFPVSVGVFRGGWLEAAKLYRAWATNAVWCAKGPKARRADYPKSLAETPLWLRTSGDGQQVSNHLALAARAWPGLKIGVHWYNWHNSAFDTDYPEYFPAKRGVRETMGFGKRLGYLMMPYQNLRLWDEGLVSYRTFAQRGVCRRENGTPYRESYATSGRSFGVMCPGSRIWQRAVSDFVTRAVEEAGANADYFDQLGNCRSEPCFDASHDHPASGGTWWRDRYVSLLSELHAGLPGVPFTTEGTGELWMDVVDGFLLAVPPPGEVVPFYAAVYSDYTTYFGSPLNGRAGLAAFRALEARQFVWGVQLGWMFAWQLFTPEKRAFGEWMRVLGEARVRAKEALAYGEFLGELQAEQSAVEYVWPKYENPKREGSYRAELPAVLGSWWRTPGGGVVLVAVNHTETEQRVTYRSLGGKNGCELVMRPLSVEVLSE